MVMAMSDHPILAWGQRQLEFLVLVDYEKSIGGSVIIRILDERVPLHGFHVALRLKQNGFKLSFKTLYL